MDPMTTAPPSAATCRFCGATLGHTFVDLGMSPLCENFLRADQLNDMEPFYPLKVYVCDQCFLVQLEEYVSPEIIFDDYAYFSSFSDAWLAHARQYVEMMIDRFALDEKSQVVELASNDGYLLQYFVERGIPALGVEPARNVARVAIERGIPTLIEFFDEDMARRMVADGHRADVILGNNILAQVPNINSFVEGTKILLAPDGVITIEFPHLLRLMEENQFDTIYHEHFSYFSFSTAVEIFAAHGITLFDVEELWTHGGSLRVFGAHTDDTTKPVSKRAREMLTRENAAGLSRLETYESFRANVEETKRKLLTFLIDARERGKSIAAYGAPGKGNTLLNYCGIRADFLDYAADRSTYKHGRFTPGTHIPIFPPGRIAETKPDYVLILPWNLKDEIMDQLAYIRQWGGRFVVPIPELKVYE